MSKWFMERPKDTKPPTEIYIDGVLYEERKTGKWELAEMGDFNLFACSECGYRTINRWWKACPNCDAKMGGDNAMDY